MSALNASRRWTACAPVWRSFNGASPPAAQSDRKIGAAAARILARNHGHRYYDWSCADGVFRFFEHPVHFTREQAYEGKYVIQSEEADVSAFDAVRLAQADHSWIVRRSSRPDLVSAYADVEESGCGSNPISPS
jgi:hypothetical protein